MPLANTLKAVIYALFITFIITNGLKIFNTLNALQVERIQQIQRYK